jgi:hypothetical protein
MHIKSSRNDRQTLRYTSMSRRRHLGTKIARDRMERFIKHHDDVEQIRLAKQRLSNTNTYSTSITDFDEYVSLRGQVVNVLGPLYENPIFRRIRWRTSIGKQRDLSLLGNLIRRKFGSNPLIVMGDKSAQTTVRFQPPTQGVAMRYQLYRLRFHVMLVDEYRTSTSCPDCGQRTMKTLIKRINPRPWKRQAYPETSIHGLLECNSIQCRSDCGGRTKKWNRDLMAVCNFRRIWDAHLNGRERPDDLKVLPRNVE